MEIRPRGRNKLGIALIVHPQEVIEQQRQKGNVDEDLWAEYELICEEFGVPHEPPHAGSSGNPQATARRQGT